MSYSAWEMSAMIVSASVTFAIALYANLNRRERSTRFFALLMICRFVFAGGVILEIISEPLAGKLFFRNLQQSSLTVGVPLVVLFVLDYLGKDKLLKPLRVLPMMLIFAVWTLFIWTDPAHGIIRKEIFLDEGHLMTIRAAPAVGFNLFCLTVMVTTLLYLALQTRRAGAVIRVQAIWICIYFSVPVVVEMTKLARPELAPLLMPVSVYSGLLGIGTFWVIYKYKLFSIMPIAREKVIEAIREGVLIADDAGTVIDHNASVLPLFGRRPEERDSLIDRGIGELLVPWPEWLQACGRMEESGMEITADAGEDRSIYQVRVYPLMSERGRKRGTISVLSDITENRKRYEQMRELNRMKDRLFTVVSHDIRDPLAVLVNLTELLEEEKPSLRPDSAEVVDAVRDQARNTYAMVENLLEWFRSQKGGMTLRPKAWDLAEIAGDTVHMLQVKSETKNIAVRLAITEGIRVYADREAIDLVLRNLLSNAIKFTECGGTIEIGAESAKDEVLVSVCDSGVGIASHKLERLFEHAYFGSTTGTSGEKGTGLGLFVCKEFVGLSGGRIGVRSEPGSGSTFWFTLPPAAAGS